MTNVGQAATDQIRSLQRDSGTEERYVVLSRLETNNNPNIIGPIESGAVGARFIPPELSRAVAENPDRQQMQITTIEGGDSTVSALVVGVATYYVGAAIRDYGVLTATNVVWTAVALVAGPVMGASGAGISTRRERPPVLAVALPAAMLVAEGFFLLVDRKMWRSDFGAETYRLIDLGVVLALVGGGLVLPWVFLKDRPARATAYVLVVAGGAFGAFMFVLLQRLIVAVV